MNLLGQAKGVWDVLSVLVGLRLDRRVIEFDRDGSLAWRLPTLRRESVYGEALGRPWFDLTADSAMVLHRGLCQERLVFLGKVDRARVRELRVGLPAKHFRPLGLETTDLVRLPDDVRSSVRRLAGQVFVWTGQVGQGSLDSLRELVVLVTCVPRLGPLCGGGETLLQREVDGLELVFGGL